VGRRALRHTIRPLVTASAKYLLGSGPERHVPLRWLFKRPGLINRRFARRARIVRTQDGPLQIVTVNDDAYVWPTESPVENLIEMCAEQMIHDHPHQYLWGPTTIERGDVVLDIGACEGAFSLRAAMLGAQVVAVEPSRIMTAVIRELFQIRKIAEPVIVSCLLTDTRKQAHFVDNPGWPGGSCAVSESQRDSYPVWTETLDGLVRWLGLTKLDFIKCDAEGSDVAILRSGEQTLTRLRPKLAICTYHNERDFTELYEYLHGLGYCVQGKGLVNVGGTFRVMMIHGW